MTKHTIIIIYLVCLATTFQCEVYHIGHSQSPNDADHCLTLAQFVYNSIDFLTNDTQLIFAPGNYSLDSEILVENVHSFSMFVEPIFSSKAVIICDHNARFEFRNINIVTVSGLDFVGCFENLVVSVGHLKLKNSHFHGQAVVNGTVLIIDESTATLDRVAFISTVGTYLQDGAYDYVNSSEYCPTERATGVLSRRSVIVIAQSWFEGNSVGLGRVIDNYDSNIMIFNTTFVNNNATTYCCYNCCFTGSIVAANSLQNSTMKIYNSKFVQNIGEIVYAADTNLSIHYNTFINNTGRHRPLLLAMDTNMNISHSVFVGNAASSMVTVYVYGREFTSIDHSKFTNNTGSVVLYGADVISITHGEFVENTVATDWIH